MSTNVFNTSGTVYLGTQAFAMNSAKMLVGDPTAEIQAATRLNSSNPPLQPVDLDGSALPPLGAPANFLLWPSNNTYRVYHYHVDFTNPANSTFTLFGSPAAAPFTVLCPGNRNCIPQKGTTARLDGIGDRLMFRSSYRNFGDHESIVGNYTVSVSGIAGIRWFELRGVTAGPVTTFQEGTYSPDSTNRWMGSIAMDNQGNMLLGFSASDATIFPQIRYTGRLVSDPLGTMPQGEAHLFDGTGSQNDSSFFRWGDYSAMSVDPSDDLTFWYTQEYYQVTSSFNWRTRIGNVKLASAATDTVTIKKAQYSISNSQLTVQATDSNPAAVLDVKVTSSGQDLGTMRSRGDGTYQLKKGGIANPVNITVTSNLGGSASADVRAR
jgi:hypothetical protein